MKHQWKGFVAGMLVTLLLVGSVGTAMATTGKKAVEITYNNISVTLDGQPVNLKDANGNPVEPFMLSGTNYLPVRAVAEALGLEVAWDGATQTVILTRPTATQPGQSQNGTPNNGGGGVGGSGNADNFNTWDNPDQQNTTAAWVLNTSTLKIHYPSCSEVSRIAPQNYATSNLSEAELLAQGYTTCGRCH